jgi:stage V sporulation protein AE
MEGVSHRIIVVTDGDKLALRALKIAAKRTHCRVISQSAGNPTRLSGIELVELIKQTPYDPVLVMLDDNGDSNESLGETALSVLAQHPDITVIGALAVASNTPKVNGTAVDFSVDWRGNRVETGVDKDGIPIMDFMVFGDTVDILRKENIPLIVGIGDIGKMQGFDAPEKGAPITTKALRFMIARSTHSTHSAHSLPSWHA